MRGFASFIAGAALGLVFAASLAGILSIRAPLPEPDAAPADAPKEPPQESRRGSGAGGSGAETATFDADRTDQENRAAEAREPADASSPDDAASEQSSPKQPAREETGAVETAADEDSTETVAATEAAAPAGPDHDSSEAPPPDPDAAAPASPVEPPSPFAPAAPGLAASDPPGDIVAVARAAAATVPAPPDAAGRPAAGSSLPPFEANAAVFSGDRSAPLLAIALIDLGERRGAEADEGRAATEANGAPPSLSRLSGPLAVVLDRSAEAQALTPDLRAAGFEVLIGLDADALRGAGGEGDGAREMIDALAGDAGAVIGAAALGAPLLDAALADEVANALAAAGFGLLDATGGAGGSALFARAAEGDLPAVATGRRIDAVETSAYVYQSLERAAYEARGAGAFVAVGDLSPTVLTGVRRWLALKADGPVTLAPLSVVMTKIAER